jgi:regulator of protease activity HflC (stomatin/prohibitin superfamily)
LEIQRIIKRIVSTSLFISIIGALFVILFLWSMTLVYIKPYEFGIKEVKFGIGVERGIQKDIYESGLHFVIPRAEKIYKFPKNIQTYTLTHNSSRSMAKDDKAAHIQTSDGFFVDIDVTVMYRIEDPYKVINILGTGAAYITDGIAPKVEPILKATLGELTTEEFYNPYLRVEKMQLAKTKMNIELKPKGLVIDNVLIRYFVYSNEIQKSIEDKKLKDQLVFKNKAEAAAAKEGAYLSKVIQEGEAILKIKLEEGHAYVVKKNATRELYTRTLKAKGNLLIKRAEAEKTRLKNIALKGIGSDNMVGLKMAEVLEGLEVIMLPSDGKDGVNPLNLNKLIKLF